MGKLKICFAGTPAFAAIHLTALLENGHDVVAVYTQPDRPSGRGKKLQASAVKQIALAHDIPLHQPISLKASEQESILSELNPDLLVVVAYGLILPKAILEIPKYGCINVHASLLPRWRGAAPIERALLAGDKESGVTIMQMDEGLDTGDMLCSEAVGIERYDTRVMLENKLAEAGCRALLSTLSNFEDCQKHAVKQDDSESTYAKKLEKSEALINWTSSASLIDRQIRAGIGRSPAYTFLDRQRLRIISAKVLSESHEFEPGTIVSLEKNCFTVACDNSVLEISQVQLAGKKATSVRDVINSRPAYFETGKQFCATDNSEK
ncbi:MAG: methionyl-tRNA formyltransferase [SAR86 cluster bacterium]|uniref:Methionyl-tRNA formyltransferase n=1 Tax=SAR86 cluster bacterium TaxID=2030880 RepID=A0A2A5B882_9GAMM|nr:MAG: methionyl-tRNA formyltransferase [SAR86 cluster bacterium]